MTLSMRWAFAVALALVGCAHQHRLVMPDTNGSSRYSCAEGRACKPSERDVPGDNTTHGTDFVVGPRECAGLVNEIIVRGDEIEVVCASPQNDASEETGGGAAGSESAIGEME